MANLVYIHIWGIPILSRKYFVKYGGKLCMYTYILVNFSGVVDNYGTSQYKANGRILSLRDDNV